MGAQVRKGEKSAFIVFWKFRDSAGETEYGEEEEENKKHGRLSGKFGNKPATKNRPENSA